MKNHLLGEPAAHLSVPQSTKKLVARMAKDHNVSQCGLVTAAIKYMHDNQDDFPWEAYQKFYGTAGAKSKVRWNLLVTRILAQLKIMKRTNPTALAKVITEEHGKTDDKLYWVSHKQARRVLSNLAAEKRIKEHRNGEFSYISDLAAGDTDIRDT